VVLADRATEEALAAVARRRAVVLPGRAVVADGAVGARSPRTDGGRRRRELGTSRVVDGRHDAGVQVSHAAAAQLHEAQVLSICTPNKQYERKYFNKYVKYLFKVIIMVALWYRADHYILMLLFVLSSSSSSSSSSFPRLISAAADWMSAIFGRATITLGIGPHF